MVEQQANYRDPTENNFPDDYDQTKVDGRVVLRSKAVRQKKNGVDVRGALAQGIEIAGAVAGESVQSANDAKAIARDTQNRFNDQIAGSTHDDEVIDARRPADAVNAYQTLGARLDDMPSNDDIRVAADPTADIGRLPHEISAEVKAFAKALPSEGFKILMVTDSHYEDLYDETVKGAYPSGKYALNHLAVVDYLSQFVDVVIAGGDNTNGIDGNYAHTKADQAIYASRLLQSAHKVDRFMLVGNHDDGSAIAAQDVQVKPDNVMTNDDFEQVFRTADLAFGEQRDQDDSLYFYKDYPDQKLRVIGLNSVDIPYDLTNSDGSAKYTRWLDYSYSQRQMDWLVEDALVVPTGYQALFVTHIPLVYGFNPAANAHWYNSDLLEGIINAFASGSKFVAHSHVDTPLDLAVQVVADFTQQGARPVVGLWAGHVHIEAITRLSELVQVLFLADVNTDPKNVGTINELGVSVASVDTVNHKVTIKGLGRATDREYSYGEASS